MRDAWRVARQSLVKAKPKKKSHKAERAREAVTHRPFRRRAQSRRRRLFAMSDVCLSDANGT